MLPEKIDCLADTGIAKLNMRNDDRVQLGRDLGCAARISCEGVCDRIDGLAVAADWFLPAFLHLPELARSRLVVGVFAVTEFRVIDFFLSSPRRHIVGIKTKDLVISLERQIVPAGKVITVGFSEQRFYFFDFREELGANRLVEITGLVQMREQLYRRTTVGIVTVA